MVELISLALNVITVVVAPFVFWPAIKLIRSEMKRVRPTDQSSPSARGLDL